MTSLTLTPRLPAPPVPETAKGGMTRWLGGLLRRSSIARRTRYAQLLFRQSDAALARDRLSRDRIMQHTFGRFYHT